MVSTPSSTEESAGYTWRRLCARGRRGGHGAADPEPDGAAGDHDQREQLRLGEAEQDVVVAANELDEEALGAGEDQIEREQGAGPPAVAEPPQHGGDYEHRD